MNISKTLQAMVLLVLSLVGFQQARASHLAAFDLYVTYVGAGVDGCTGTTKYDYEIAFDLYRSCEGGAPLPLSASINYGSASLGFNTSVNINITAADVDTVSELCDSLKPFNSCAFPSNSQFRAYERGKFRALVTLPGPAPDWVFSWSSCCRNGAILNINPGSMYAECGLNNVIKYNNSTPRFTVPPLPYICANQPVNYLNGPIDPNSDSLYVSNATPFDAAGTPSAYQAGYNLIDPVGSAASNPYKVDPFTGTASFTPNAPGFYVLAFQCDEYDRATKVRTGYSRRDAQVSIFSCTAPPPVVDTLISNGVLTNSSFVNKSLLVCPGSNMTYEANSNSAVSTSKLYMDANEVNFPGATFNVTGEGSTAVKGVFAWTPTLNELGEHTLIITSKDSTCSGGGYSIVLKNYVVILIRVVRGLDAGKDLPICELNPTPRQLFVKGAEFINTIRWNDINGGPALNLTSDTIINPVASPTVTREYVVSTPDLKGACKASDTVKVFLDNSNTIDIFPQATPFVMCRPDYLQLDVTLTGKGPINNLPCGPSVQPAKPTDSVDIFGSPVYGSDFTYDSLGTGTPILYNTIRSTKYQYLISKEDFRQYDFRSSTIRSLAFQTVRNTSPASLEYRNFTISMKCTNKKALSKVAGFETGMIPVYIAPGPIAFPDQWHKFIFDTPYDWDTTKNLIIEICYSNNPIVLTACNSAAGINAPPVLTYMPTTYVSGLELRAPDTIATTVCNVTNNAGIKEYLVRPLFRLGFNDAPYLPFNIIWNPGQFLSDSTSKQPLSYVSKSTRYTVNTFGNSGCIIRDTLDVYVPVHDFSVLPKDTSICFGETAPLEVRKGTYHEWFEFEDGKFKSAHESLSCDLCPNPIAKPKKTTHYKIKVGDEVFCYDTLDAYIEVKPLPLVNILTNDTVVKYGQSVQLLVNGARLYNWSPVSSLNNPNISYPIATPKEPTMYVVGGIGSNGCRAYDTVRVNIDYRDNLFIPTAFSPNGDGKNDVFKVSNMTFQRFVEFRVFNRWGQEIYSGNDARKGWDGTWKGVTQETGNYQYLIRVAYPDGYVETYKGDVTLVR